MNTSGEMEGFCRDCLRLVGEAMRCPHCGSTRVLAHPELQTLSIAHLDCDAFYAAIEKRDAPELHNKPVIVGGAGRRGVVSTACYIARLAGVLLVDLADLVGVVLREALGLAQTRPRQENHPDDHEQEGRHDTSSAVSSAR